MEVRRTSGHKAGHQPPVDAAVAVVALLLVGVVLVLVVLQIAVVMVAPQLHGGRDVLHIHLLATNLHKC